MLWKKQLIVVAFALTLCVLFCGAASAANTTNMVTAVDNSSSVNSSFDCQVMNVQVPFVENQGQTDGRVKYYAQTFYGTVYITTDGITHSIQDKEGNKTLVLNEQFLDATGNPIQLNPRGEEPSSTVVSYFTGDNRDNWKTNLTTYNLINLGEIYPGITVKLKAHGNNIEKLFYLKPGANSDDIKIGIQGADQLNTDPEGKLVIGSSGFPDVTLSAPEATQNNKTVESTYQITENTYGFTLGNYNHQQPLTIDPTLTYSTYLGGNSGDHGNAIVVDANGNIYITGFTDSTDFPTTTGAYQTDQPGRDVFVSKLNSDGTALIYSTYLGGTGYDSGSGIAVDADGNTYITGSTDSDNFPTVGAYQTTYIGYGDVFVSKLNPTGTDLLYSTYLGGNDDDWGSGIAVDADGNIYIVGSTRSDNFPTVGAYQTDQPGTDVFVSKLNPTLTGTEQLIYSTYLGGTSNDEGYGIAVDANGNIYITGYTVSTGFPTTTGALQTNNKGGLDVFVSKLNPDPNIPGTEQLIYSTYLGGNNLDGGSGIAVDADSNIYIVGSTTSNDFPTVGALQTNNKGGADVFVSKLNPTLTGTEQLIYSTYLGGNNHDWGNGIAVDTDGNAYITGETDSDNFPITPGAYQTDQPGTDVFVSKLNPTLTGTEQLIYSTYLGGTGYDTGSGIAVDADGNTYITGYTWSDDFPTVGALQTSIKGILDGFVVKFSATADLAVGKVVDFAIQSLGGDVTYTITATNNGPDDATGVTVTDLMPSGLHLVSATSPNYDMGTDTWNIGNLAHGATATLQIVARILQAGTFTNTAIITGQEIDPIPGNNQATATVTGLSAPPKLADLAVTKTVDLASQWVGQNVTYTITATNNGPSDATGVTVSDPVPVGLGFVSASASTGTSYNTTTNTWNIGNLANTATATLKIIGRILQSGTFTNTATITGQQTDPVTSNNQATVTVLGQEATAPLVINTVPASNATGVSLNPTITINFNQPVILGSGWVQLKLTASPGTNIPISPLTINGNTATFKTLSTLSKGTRYTIIVHSGSVNATNGGLPLASPYVTRFTTATPPLVTSTVPANSATGVSLNPTITIKFNQPVTLGSGWVQLKITASPGTNIAISPLTINGNTATFKPASALARGTQYTIIVHSGSVNATNGGLPLASPYVTRFTTQT